MDTRRGLRLRAARFLTYPDSGLDLSVVLEDQERVAIGNIAVNGEPAINGHDSVDVLPPKVSVVIPCYRQAHFLTEAIASALRQSYSNLEIIVVDDGSPDNTEEVVRRFPGVRSIRQRNQGLAAARNAGVRASTGDFVIFLDADDRLVPGAVTSGMSLFLQNPEYGLVAGQFRFIGLDGFVLATPRPRSSRSDQYIEMVGDYFIGPPGVAIFRRAALDRVGLFDSSISPAADYDMALRIAREFPIRMHDEIALEYRRHGANMSGDPAVMMATTMTALRRQWRFVRKTERGRRAYESGVRHWRECWGEPLVQKVVADARARNLIDALNGFGTLLRYHRTGFFDAVRALRHRDGEVQASSHFDRP